MVAMRLGSSPREMSSLFGLISSCQFFWMLMCGLSLVGAGISVRRPWLGRLQLEKDRPRSPSAARANA